MKQKKEKRITLRVTPEQYEAIQSKAEMAQMSTGAYVRAAALRHRVVVIDGLKEFTHELKGIGRNVNQLVVLTNMGRIQEVRLGADVLGMGWIGKVTIFRVVALLQQEKTPAVLTPADQVAGLQPLVEVQLQHGLEAVCFVVLIDFEHSRAWGRFLWAKMNPHVIHVGVKSSSLCGIGNPLISTLVKQKFVQRIHIVIGRQPFQ